MPFRIAVLGLFFLAALGCIAEDRPSRLKGRVLDPSSSTVPDATIRVFNRDNAIQRNTRSGSDGVFEVTGLPAGNYLVEARTTGLDQASPVAVVIKPGEDASVDVRLEIQGLATRVVVTSVANPQSTEEAGKAMDTIDTNEMERREEFTFTEAVRLTPGLRVQQLGGPGSFARIMVRGLRAMDTGVLIDGMRFRDVAAVQGDATAYIGDLQLVDTDRIEILRGTGSSLYGTNALGGVLNLVTDQGGGRPHGQIAAEGGGLGLFRGLAKAAGGLFDDKLQYSGGLSYLKVNGGIDGVENVRNTSAQGMLMWRPTASTSLTGRLLGTDATVGLNSAPYAAPSSNLPPVGIIPAIPLTPQAVQLGDRGLPFPWGNATFAPNFYDPDGSRVGQFWATGIAWNQQVAPRISYRVSYQALLSSRDNRNGPGGSGFQPGFNNSTIFDGRDDIVQARTDVTLARSNMLTAGYEWEREDFQNISTDQNPDPAGRLFAASKVVQKSNSIFVQDQMRFFKDRLNVSLSGRWQGFSLDRPSFEGGSAVYDKAPMTSPSNALTGDAAVAWLIPSTSTKLRAHAGNGYRAPSLYERFGTYYFFGSFSPLGDPQLAPEHTLAFDFGVDQYFANSKYRLSATYFYTRLQNVIVYGSVTDDPYGRFGGYQNGKGGLARGIELSGEARPWRSMLLRASYTYTNADERQSTLIGGYLPSIRVFPNMLTFVATQQIGRRWSVTADYWGGTSYVSGSFFVGSGSRPYRFEGPNRLDASVEYALPLGERYAVRFFTRVENIFNQRYFEDGFRTPQIWATVGARFAF